MSEVATKKCGKCGFDKPLSSYGMTASGHKRGTCRRCQRGLPAQPYGHNTGGNQYSRPAAPTSVPPAAAVVYRQGPPETANFEITEDPVAAFEARREMSRDKQVIKQLIEELREARARVAFTDEARRNSAPPAIIPRETASKIREMTPVVLASDWHVEESVEAESVAYRNAYDLKIADKRVKRFFNAIIWNVEHHRASGRIAIRDLVLWLGGDLMTGYIHEELMEGNALSPTQTILWLTPRIRDGIQTLLDRLELEHLEIPCSFGNHGRTTDRPRVSSGYANSFEWLMYNNIASEFRNEKRIHFEITGSGHQYVEVYGKMLHFHHGDDVKYMGGVGGLGIPLLKAVPMWDLVKRADVHNIGHHHQLRDFGRAVVNGSLIGYGPYSQRIRAEFEPPMQAMYYMDKVRGKSMVTSLWAEKADVDYRGATLGE